MNASLPQPSDARVEALHAIQQVAEWDVIVIGGGASGLGVAVDAAARGFQTLLLEAHDFSKGTSSKTTKLIHGGVRYLVQGNWALVQEALKERRLLLKNAPHIVRPLEFVIPTYRCFDTPKYAAGLKMYDILAAQTDLPSSRLLSAAQVQQKIPSIITQQLKAGIAYFDAQFDDSRLAISLVRTLIDLKGHAVNYMPVVGFELEDQTLVGVNCLDSLTQKSYQIRAKCVVNATGVWTDQLHQLHNPHHTATVRPSKGVHIVLDQSFLPSQQALMIPKTEDGRVLFAVPWNGAVLVGTTDTEQSATPIEPQATAADIQFLLKTLNQYLTRPAKVEDVLSVWAGLRPLIQEKTAQSTQKVSREHRIETHYQTLLTVTGGKWTTYRKMAADVLQVAIDHHLLPYRPVRTENLRLHGAPELGTTSETNLPYYGTDSQILQSLPGWTEVYHAATHLTAAHIRFAVRYEMAQTVEDVLARRHRLLFLDARAAISLAPKVAEIMAEELQQGSAWQQQMIQAFLETAHSYLPETLLAKH